MRFNKYYIKLYTSSLFGIFIDLNTYFTPILFLYKL